MLLWTWAAASAADLHLNLDIDNSRVEQATWPATEALSKRFGPVRMGKTSTVFLVTASPSVFDPLQAAYRVELNVCIEWTRKAESGQYCDRKELLVPGGDQTVRHEVSVKAKDKLEWASELWFSGEAPPAGLPAEAQETEAPPEGE